MGGGEAMLMLTTFLLIVVITPIFLHFRGERRKRELEHIERIRAIDAGRPYPGENRFGLPAVPRWVVPQLVAGSIGAVVPLGVFLFAFLTSLIGGFHKDIWIAAGMVGLGAVICGAVLAGTAFQAPAAASDESERSNSYLNSKPHVDEDAYDVVSSRG
jgi:hypothetical protein